MFNVVGLSNQNFSKGVHVHIYWQLNTVYYFSSHCQQQLTFFFLKTTTLHLRKPIILCRDTRRERSENCTVYMCVKNTSIVIVVGSQTLWADVIDMQRSPLGSGRIHTSVFMLCRRALGGKIKDRAFVGQVTFWNVAWRYFCH